MYCQKCNREVGNLNYCITFGEKTFAYRSNVLPVQRKWYQSIELTVIFLIFFFPLGLFLLWKYQKGHAFIKSVVTITGIAIFMGIFSSMINKPVTIDSDIPVNNDIQNNAETSSEITNEQQAIINDNQLSSDTENLNGTNDINKTELEKEIETLKEKIETLEKDNSSLILENNNLREDKSTLFDELQKYKENESNNPKISKEEYDQIKTGMNYGEVCKIIGGEGTSLAETNIADTTTIMYSWNGDGDLGASAVITFDNNEVFIKSQYGLE
jgi:regulator of replication initiation timing